MDKNRRYSTYFRLKVAGLCLVIFGFYFTNISLFQHYHIINGVTIVHSHICSEEHRNNPNNSDAHTEKELTLIQHISSYIVESPKPPITISAILQRIDIVYIAINSGVKAEGQYEYIYLRGPPLFLS